MAERVIDASFIQVYGARIENLRLPGSETKRAALAEQYGRDGYHLLDALAAPGTPSWLVELPAVAALRQVWVQQYYRQHPQPPFAHSDLWGDGKVVSAAVGAPASSEAATARFSR